MRTDDLVAEPWLYPGTAVGHSDRVEAAELEPGAGRTLVLAVGSNASRAVLRRKFERYGLTADEPMVRARVSGLRVGHSAHVAAAGYIPAAPVAEPTATTDLVASLLADDALAVLDATEPNYVRRTFSTDRFDLEVEVGDRRLRPRAFELYVSRHGVIAAPGAPPLDLLAQEELFALLVDRCPGFGALAAGAPRDAMRALAGSVELREAARGVLGAAGWVAGSIG